jgi:hypothetical protein
MSHCHPGTVIGVAYILVQRAAHQASGTGVI